jgi:hypothetical protein
MERYELIDDIACPLSAIRMPDDEWTAQDPGDWIADDDDDTDTIWF